MYNFCPVTSKKALQVQGETHSSAKEIFMGLLWCLGCSYYTHQVSLQISRPTENKRPETFLKGVCFFAHNTKIRFALLSFNFELLASILLTAGLAHFNMEKQNRKSPSSNCKWNRLLVAIFYKRHQTKNNMLSLHNGS